MVIFSFEVAKCLQGFPPDHSRDVGKNARLLILLALSGFLFPPFGLTEGQRPSFDAERAFGLLKKQVSFGSRTPGRPGHERALTFLRDELKAHSDRFSVQELQHKNLNLTNLIGWIKGTGELKETVLLGAHWDTHPFASREEDSALARRPVPGANDGASGVALLLELARGLSRHRPPRDILIVLFDGEDYGIGGNWILGSTHFAKNWEGPRADFGIVVDMVGDKDLEIYVEGFSSELAPRVVRRVWDAAERVGAPSFHREVRHYLIDDHAPFNDAGVPTALLIDFDYPSWHTSRDTADQVSPKSLAEVAGVLIEVLFEREAR